MKRILMIMSLCGAILPGAQADELDQLLQQTREEQRVGSKINREREARFLANKNAQQQLLQAAQAEQRKLEERGKKLKAAIEIRQKRVAAFQQRLDERTANLKELFQVVRQTASALRTTLRDSQVSAQYPARDIVLKQLAQKDSLPNRNELNRLWFILQQEMTEGGKVVQFEADVVLPGGTTAQRTVTRVGAFTALSGGAFLNYLPNSRQFVQPERQLPAAAQQTAQTFTQTPPDKLAAVHIDPTRGALLTAMAQAPDLRERVHQGREVGYIIIALGVLGLLIAFFRVVYLAVVGFRIRRQAKRPEQLGNNALGRILSVADNADTSDLETLELRLDEAIQKETPKLERGQTLIKLLAAVAPLLGLLGTVTGMISTFQSISVFGTGDPKLMAGGISQALVTTVLGLVVAIPLLFSHSFVASRSRSLIQILDQQSAGLLARLIEPQTTHPAGDPSPTSPPPPTPPFEPPANTQAPTPPPLPPQNPTAVPPRQGSAQPTDDKPAADNSTATSSKAIRDRLNSPW